MKGADDQGTQQQEDAEDDARPPPTPDEHHTEEAQAPREQSEQLCPARRQPAALRIKHWALTMWALAQVCVAALLALAILPRAAAFGVAGGVRAGGLRAATAATAPAERVVSGARSMTMMPIGIPKVAYKMPGSRGGEWVDIYQRLTRERIIFMGSEIDDEMANQIIGVLLVSRRLLRRLSFLVCLAATTTDF